MRLLATSDLHLGRHSSLSVDRDDSFTASARTWENIVEYTIREDMDMLLLAGDLVEKSNRFYEAIVELEKGIGHLAGSGIPVVMVSGNHDLDVLPEIVRNLDNEHVHLIGQNGKWETQTIRGRNGEELQVTGWSFPENTDQYRTNPMNSFVRPPDTNLPSIGLLHCDMNQLNSVYAPVTDSNFFDTNIDYWVLGHVHKPVLIREKTPTIIYPGAPHPFDAGETEAGFVRIINTDELFQSEKVSLTPIRYHILAFEVTDDDENQLRSHFYNALRELTESPDLQSDYLKLIVLDVQCQGNASVISRFIEANQYLKEEGMTIPGNLEVMVRKWIEQPVPDVDLERLAENSDPAGVLASWLNQIQNEDELSDDLRNLLVQLQEEYSKLAADRVFEPLEKVPEPDEDFIRDLVHSQGMKLLHLFMEQVEDQR